MDPVELFNEVLKLAVEADASDIVVNRTSRRISGSAAGSSPWTWTRFDGEAVRGFVDATVPGIFATRGNTTRRSTMRTPWPTSVASASTAFSSAGTTSVVFRYVKSRPPTFEQLNLDSETLIRLAKAKDGILLVCGATGSGKSSTMAAMLNWINQNLDRHIVTIEDPIELPSPTTSRFSNSGRSASMCPRFPWRSGRCCARTRIILIGEMRDKETFETAISAPRRGHLVFSTMHRRDHQQALTRLFEFFPPEQLVQARRQVAGSIRGSSARN